MKYLLTLFVLLGLTLGIFQLTQASEKINDTWTVCASGCDFTTIASAVVDAQVNSGDTLDLAAETFPDYDILLNKDLTLVGAGQEMTTIDAQLLGRVISITQGTTVAIHDLTITGGYTYDIVNVYGGGIFNNGSLSLYNVGVINNEAVHFQCGGGIYNAQQANLLILDSLILDNVARLNGRGGGLCNDGEVSIDSSIFRDNGAARGAGAIANGGTLNITQTIFDSNGSYEILVNGIPGAVMIDKSVFINNSGNAVVNYGQMTIVNTTISQNSVGISNSPYGQLNVAFTTITQNSQYGISNGMVEALLIENSIIAQNGMKDCKQDLGEIPTTFGANLDSDDSCGLNHPSDLPNTDPGLAILGDYGGNTMAHALLTTSPALDAGINCGTVTEDQRGFPRPVGAACDIGAFEGIVPFSQYAYMPIARK